MNRVILGLLLVATGCHAKIYQVNVKLNIGQATIEHKMVKRLYFPPLTVHDNTEEGAYCYSINNLRGKGGELANTRNSLCPNLVGESAQVEFYAAPHTMLTYQIDTPEQVKAGLKFHEQRQQGSASTGTPGILTVGHPGAITLIDKSAVRDGNYTFEYSISAAYQ